MRPRVNFPFDRDSEHLPAGDRNKIPERVENKIKMPKGSIRIMAQTGRRESAGGALSQSYFLDRWNWCIRFSLGHLRARAAAEAQEILELAVRVASCA